MMKNIPPFKSSFTAFAILLSLKSFAYGASSIKVEVGASPYYEKIPCIAKIAFKYKNQDFEPLITRQIQKSLTRTDALIATTPSEEKNILEYISVYILQVGKDKNVDAIQNKFQVVINAKANEIKEIKLWFEEDLNGDARILRAKIIPYKYY